MHVYDLIKPGESMSAAARRLGVPLNTFRGWRHSIPGQRYRHLFTHSPNPPTAPPAIPDTAQYFTVAQAANLVGISPCLLRKWIARNYFPALRLQTPGAVRNTYRIPKQPFLDYLQTRWTMPGGAQ